MISGEWQPFPEDWLQYGHIESVCRAGSRQLHDVSLSEVQLEDRQRTSSDSSETPGDRMGTLNHPTKGDTRAYYVIAYLRVSTMDY